MPVDPSRISSNLNEIRSRIAAACARAGRPGSGVRLVAVTKTVDLDEVQTLHALGLSDFKGILPAPMTDGASLGPIPE